MPYSNRDLPPPPSSNDKIPAKASHSGRKTSASAATATAALVAVPLDPTGVALLTFVGSGTMAVGGLAYDSGHKAVHLIEDRVTRHRAKKAGTSKQASSDSQILALSDPRANYLPTIDSVDLPTELESCIRRLSGSITGVVVSGSMSFILPPFLLGLALNSTQLMFQARRLHHLTTIANARGGVDRYLSSTDLTFQVISGILIKSALLLFTLGTEVDTVIEGFAQLLVSAEVVLDPALIPSTWEQAGHIGGLYDELTAHEFLHTTGQVAGEPANLVAGLLGYQQMPTWDMGASERDVMEIGGANVLVDLATAKLVEDPTHEVLDFATRLGRRFGRRGKGGMKEMGLKH